MKDFIKSLKILDVIIFAAVIFYAITSSMLVYGTKNGTLHLMIKSPIGEWIYPLDKPAVIEIEGKIGKTKILINENKASVMESVCPHKTCISSGTIEKAGDWNACMPNQVFIYIVAD